MILDLSLTDEWLNNAKEAIQHVIPSEVVEQVRKLNYEELYSDTLDYLLEAYDNTWAQTSFDELEVELDQYFCSKYVKIKGFHACRITNETSYKQNGIRRICEDLLVELATERFSKHKSIEKIINACKKQEIDNHDRSVFFFPSIERAKESSQNHYLKCGSELLQGLAWDLGLGNQGILCQQGTSCIIECDIRLQDVKQMFRYDFWRQLITFSFQESLGKVFEQKAPDWGFATICDIPPKQLKTFHYIKDSDYTYSLLRH